MTFFEPENLCEVTGGRWLRRPGATFELRGVGIDTREDLHFRAFAAIKGERFDGHDFLDAAVKAGACVLIVERQPSLASIQQGIGVLLVDGVKGALAKLALAYRRTLTSTTVIAVAGSAGKTTTKRLIDAALSSSMQGSVSPKSFNNDIGVPLTILNSRATDRYLIVEVGTNHLGEIAPLARMIEPDIAVITMIGREHLEGLGSLEQIADENAQLLKHLRKDGTAIINADAPLLRPHLKGLASTILFGEAPDAAMRLTARGHDPKSGHWWFEVDGKHRFGLSLPGKHNAINALVAVAIARRLGVADQQISHGLARARGAPMRSAVQWVGPVLLYNDAYNANPDSMSASLQTFIEVASHEIKVKRRILVLGDMLEMGDAAPEIHRELGRTIIELDRRTRIDHAVLIGQYSAFAAAEISRRWRDQRMLAVGSLDEATVQEIAGLIKPGDAVLLKASRGMGLERIAGALESRFAAAAVPAAHR